MGTNPETLRFMPPGLDAPVTVERLDLSMITPELGDQVGVLLAEAYAAAFEEPHGSFPPGVCELAIMGRPEGRELNSIALAYDIQDAMVEFGSDFWVVRDTDGRVCSMVRMTPEIYGPYVNNIVTAPRRQGQRLGGCALHAALCSSRRSAHSLVELDAFADSPVNAWYERLGFRYLRTQAKPYRLAPGCELTLQRYGDVTLSDVCDRLALRTGPPLPG